MFDSPEFVDYWTFRFSDLYRVAIFPIGINPKWTQMYSEWIRDFIERDRPYDEVARERIAAQGYASPTRHYLPYLQIPPPENMMGEEVRVYMGRRLDCAQCHDHPYEEWTQDQFWGMTAFFGPMFKLGGGDKSVVFDFPDGKEVAPDVPSPKELRVVHPRTQEPVQPTLLNGTVVAFSDTGLPRRELAKWMTSHPYFAEATVNRIWSLFFGRGFVNPVDDFRSTNPPTHPQLLSRLAEDFARNGYLSQASDAHDRDVEDLSAIERHEHHQRRGQGSTIPTRCPGPSTPRSSSTPSPMSRAVEERFEVGTNRGVWRGGTAPLGTRAVQLKETDIYPSVFLDLYGRANRFSVPERDASPKLTQALHMLAGSTYNDKLWTEGARVFDLFRQGASDEEIVNELYLAALSRAAGEAGATECEATHRADSHSGNRRCGICNGRF